MWARHTVISLLLVLVMGTSGAAVETVSPASQVQRWLDSWTTLSGRFQQTLASPTLPSAEVETGLFKVARPDRMRWDYRDPERKLAVSDGRQTWLYLPADAQVVHGSLDSLRREGGVSLLLSGTLRLAEAFTVDSVLSAGSQWILHLSPRDPGSEISSVDLRASSSDGEIQGFSMTDAAGNVVAWRFWDLQLNLELADQLFHFEVPQGVELQELEAAPGPVENP